MDLKVCRVCCENKGDAFIFNKDDKELHISAKIMYCCTNLSIAEGDGLPEHICNVCEAELATTYQFILKCEATDKTLRSCLKTNVLEQCEVDDKEKIEIKTENFDSISDEEFVVYDNSRDDFQSALDKLNEEVKQPNIHHSIQSKRKVYKKRVKYKNSGSFKCTHCGRKCPNPSSLAVHMRSHTDEKPFPCSSCDKKYKDSGTLKRHFNRNHLNNRERSFICETCGKGFYSKSDVKIHMRVHTGETPYICSECPMKFTQIGALLRHKKRHNGEKTYTCPTCNKKFCTKEELKSHLQVHTSKKEFSCTLCNGMFKYHNNLRKHMRLHAEPNSYVCNYCGRTFNVKGNLKIHISRQHSEKSGYCNVCSKSVSNIEVHMWRHTGQRPLKCELCTSSFFELKALNHHMNFKHKKVDKYKCLVEGCLMAFPSRPMLDFHTAKLHSTGIPFPCDRCSRGFYRKNDLARHKIGTHKERLN
ncbi:gastrula zinc finger protein XlCGF57.1 [Amyelois transitella]|uniref:gastrula zinc finger protein XlCGF57.1 n=1 Tax=Amyelois transitella TaxID=680683 RepID=UPI00067C61E1|nr:gastrula zinc finger protein XlCGF57.1 [Amyelois transitella]